MSVQIDALRTHACRPDHRRRARGRVLEIAADAARGLTVEDLLRRHRAEHVHEIAHRLAVPLAEALLLLERLMVAERAAAHPDREPARLEVGPVDVRGRRVAGLVDRDGARLVLDVAHADRGARLDRGHRVDEMLPVEREASLVVRVRQRHRADLLDHRRRIAVRDARDLVAPLRAVEIRIVCDAIEVEVEDVLAILFGGGAEPDVTAHAPRTRQGRVEDVHGHVRRADEVDLRTQRPRRRQPQPHTAGAARDHVDGVEERVDAVGDEATHERRVVDAVHHHEQLVQRELPLPAHHPGQDSLVHEVADPRQPGRVRRSPLRCALLEHVLAPRAALHDQVAARVDCPVRPVERRLRIERPRVLPLQRLPAHPDGVDLVDEDDALAAPLTREPFRLPREVAHDQRVDADERVCESRARDRDERRVEAGRDRLGEHRLAGARGAEKEQPALALAARPLEGLA